MSYTMDLEEIRAILPHRFPMLLVDKILEVEPGERIVGLKNVTINEPYFPGHFPGQAVMPGVLILESMAQVAGLMMLTLPIYKGKVPFIGAMDNVRFRRPVVPGDTLITEAKLLYVRGLIGKVHFVGRVGGDVVAEGDMIFALKEPTRPSDEAGKKPEIEPVGPAGNGGAGNSAGGHSDARHIVGHPGSIAGESGSGRDTHGA